MKNFLHIFFIPHPSNNFRSKLLHHKSLLFVIVLFFSASFALSILRQNFPEVLGISSDISISQLVSLTNQKREERGLPPLDLDEKLSKAALQKASDMIYKNYWAHNAPDGTTPWVFIKDSGYEYVYAGENLARGFTNSSDVLAAWMASSTHRENLLSSNYSNVGFAVKKGKLLGEETVLVVQMLGSTTLGPSIAAQKLKSSVSSTKEVLISSAQKPLVDNSFLSKTLTRSTLILFISVLFVDMIIVERRKIVRFVGHNLDHIFFLTLILLSIAILTRGVVI